MEKPAPADHPIHELLARRWSPRAFEDRLLEEEKIRTLFEAARWAPSSANEQPWRFLIATRGNPEEYERLASCLVAGNAWAKEAPLLTLSVAALDTSRGSPNRHAWHDVGLATENLLLQAYAMGLYAHPMAGFEPLRARELYAIPERCDPVAMIAIGYPGAPESLTDKLRERELAARLRRPLTEFMFTGAWEKTAAEFKP